LKFKVTGPLFRARFLLWFCARFIALGAYSGATP
jgi:hypothetical protein